ncbi:Sorting nexin-41 [Debaryomyces fabryi]|uniref:Sorting nexin-41 n=1 Tax=Debaryomyces fabryi TaxID=58627 RepID=A0A0V1PVY6_9ASCO|nr:Sorting nexin-41 [Debaryomyces fabryi]KSA00411.1 Sorting nexin-41 [Debaryomyces fabryi]CUM54141.1 unnamed protein product [Debaryomyces fabryi]
MSKGKENKVGSSTPSFDDEEDNNPFPHMQGLASLMSEHGISNGSNIQDKGDKDNNGNNGDEDDDSILLYNSNNQNDFKSGLNKDTFKSIQINYESRVTRLLRPNSNVRMQITKAGNSNEGMINTLKTYIVYSIQLINNDDPSDEIQTRRRYSDFESLRDVLKKIFPLIIIPPIPPKNYFKFSMLNDLVSGNILQSSNNSSNNSTGANTSTNTTNGLGSNSTNYSYINSTHLNKNKLIEHRKRLLSNFLNNCLAIPQIRNLEFFAKFLDPNANWTDEITLISSQLPKSIYLLNPENGLKTDSIYANLPNPVGNHSINMSFWKPLQENKKKLTKKTNKILNNGNTEASSQPSTGTISPVNNNPDHLKNKYIIDNSCLDDINKKIMANFIGLANDYTELGTIFNSFSLILSDSPMIRSAKAKNNQEEDSKLNIIFDKIGQIFDRSYITISTLIADLETKFSEPLGEAVQYSTILQFIEKFERRKVRQKRLLEDDVKEKKHELEELLKAEEESSRIESVMHVPKNSGFNSRSSNATLDANLQSIKSANNKYKYLPNMNSFKKITQYVTDIIDQNPEQTRKQKITSLQGKIGLLEKCQGIMLQDISYITDEINKNFKLFHTKQLKIIYEILLCYNGFLVEWAKKNIDIWEEIKDEVEKL